MAKKRAGLAFPDQEKKGKRAIIRSADEIAADEEALGSQSSRTTEIQDDVPLRADGRPDRAAFQKVTYRVSPDAIDAIDEVKRTLRRRYKLKVTFEEIAEAAILAIYDDLKTNEEASFLVSQFSGDPDRRISG